MTLLSVVSTITTIATGKVELGDVNLAKTSVGQVKRKVEDLANVPSESQKLWWRGYILDDNTLPLTTACVGAFFLLSVCIALWLISLHANVFISLPQV
jgi:hypothetical protein